MPSACAASAAAIRSAIHTSAARRRVALGQHILGRHAHAPKAEPGVAFARGDQLRRHRHAIRLGIKQEQPQRVVALPDARRHQHPHRTIGQRHSAQLALQPPAASRCGGGAQLGTQRGASRQGVVQRRHHQLPAVAADNAGQQPCALRIGAEAAERHRPADQHLQQRHRRHMAPTLLNQRAERLEAKAHAAVGLADRHPQQAGLGQSRPQLAVKALADIELAQALIAAVVTENALREFSDLAPLLTGAEIHLSLSLYWHRRDWRVRSAVRPTQPARRARGISKPSAAMMSR